MRRWVGRSLALVAIAVVASAVGAYARYFAPSADIDDYRRYQAAPSAPGAALLTGAVKVTYLGTTTLLFDDGQTRFMIDGFFSRPPLWKVATMKIRTDTAAVDRALQRLGVDRLQALFVAHSHYDHVLDAAYVAQRTHATLHGSASTLNVGRGGGLHDNQMALYQPGQALQLGRFSVTVLTSRHSPPKPGVNDDIGLPIEVPLAQPAKGRDYREGGSYDFLIRHGGHTILVKPSANSVAGALDQVRAEVLFLGTGALGVQSRDFQNAYYAQTVGKVRPQRVIPIHWDDFFEPLSDHLPASMKVADQLVAGFDFLIDRTRADGIAFQLLQGYQSIVLFES